MTGATPVPLMGTWSYMLVTGLITSTSAARAPIVVGANVRRSWQEPPGASACVHPEASRAKSPGLAPCSGLVIGVQLELLVLVTVSASARDRVVTRWLPKLIWYGE